MLFLQKMLYYLAFQFKENKSGMTLHAFILVIINFLIKGWQACNAIPFCF